MEALYNFIPKEYLELKINYCRQQLDLLPVVRIYKHNSGDKINKRIIVGNHKYDPNFEKGKEYYRIWQQRDLLERELQLYLSIWDYHFKGEPDPDYMPVKAKRTIWVDTGKYLIMNKEYFDSLKNDANTKYPKPSNYPFNGIYYRSAAEREIAIFYTEMGIQFKYEPEIMLKGLIKPVYPDFVPYFREIDACKIHEHFGMKDYSDYLNSSKIRFSNYANAGLIQDLDILFTHDTGDTWFDPRYLSAKLNAAIYGTVCMSKQ
ncbi:MAG: hypothetical protein K6E72_02030 [Saccharofermentans sp.]|nr:hypothetical protein [Saccharofermentans sp.]